MLWIKRNLSLLIGIVVAVGLMVGASFLLVSGLGKNRDITVELDSLKAEFQELNAKEPYPSSENIQALKQDTVRLQQLLAGIQQVLTPAAVPAVPSDQQLKQLLETTIFDLQRDAETANVVLPARYNFSFDAQRLLAKFPEGSHLALATQIGEVKAIASVLFSSGVQSLAFIKRVPVAAGEAGGTTDYLDKAIVTNKFNAPSQGPASPHYATLTPYQIRFLGFSADLEKVLDNLRRDPIFFLVKKLDIKGENSEVALPSGFSLDLAGTKPNVTAPATPPKPGTPVRPGKPGTNVVANTTALTILDEKPLEVTLLIEVVKLHKSAK